MKKGDARLDALMAPLPEQQRGKLNTEMAEAVLAKMGAEFCSKVDNYCQCNDEAIKYVEAK